MAVKAEREVFELFVLIILRNSCGTVYCNRSCVCVYVGLLLR